MDNENKSFIKNEYKHNERFREYVDRYCKNHHCAVEEVLEHELIYQVCLMYTEILGSI